MGKKSKRTRTKQTPEELKKIKLEAEIWMELNSQMGLYCDALCKKQKVCKIPGPARSRWSKQIYAVLNKKMAKIMEPSAENGNINSIR
jgi:hypothetical protein